MQSQRMLKVFIDARYGVIAHKKIISKLLAYLLVPDDSAPANTDASSLVS